MRSNFSSSRLVRLAGDWAPVDTPPSGMDFAERLSLWLNAFDAIGLQAAHRSIRAIQAVAPGKLPHPRSALPGALEEDVRRVRSTLAKAIAQDPPPDAGYSVYLQRHLELQRQMELMIGPLRDHVRQSLSRVSPGLRQLAALDAVLEQVLAPREQLLLPTVPSLVERRFEQLRLAHRQALEAAGQEDDPALWRQPGGWLDLFGKDWRQALLAELDLRLEPVAGLIEALSNELKNQP